MIKQLVSELEKFTRYYRAKFPTSDANEMLERVVADVSRQPFSPSDTAERLKDVLEGKSAHDTTCVGISPALLGLAVRDLEEHWENAERWRQRLNSVLSERDHWKHHATKRIGLRRELEQELFGEVVEARDDGGEEVFSRALAIIRVLKATHVSPQGTCAD